MGAAGRKELPITPRGCGGGLGGAARPSGRSARGTQTPREPELAGAPGPGPLSPGVLGPGRKSRNHPGHQYPLLRHLPEEASPPGTTQLHQLGVAPFSPQQPPAGTEKKRHFVSAARVRGKEGGGGAREMRVGREGDASCLPASRSRGRPRWRAAERRRAPRHATRLRTDPGLASRASEGSHIARAAGEPRLTLGCSEEPRAQRQQRRSSDSDFPRSHVCRYSTRAPAMALLRTRPAPPEAQRGYGRSQRTTRGQASWGRSRSPDRPRIRRFPQVWAPGSLRSP